MSKKGSSPSYEFSYNVSVSDVLYPQEEKDKLCLTCQHFDDRGETKRLILANDYETIMHQQNGFPGSGDCAVSYLWAEIEVNGDAVASLEVPANFGCIYHKKETKHDCTKEK